jgi:hypothetical protein
MGQRPQKTAWPGCSIRRSLGEYKELPEKFRLEMLALSLLNLYGGKCPKCENVDQDACMKAVQFAHIHIPLSVYDLSPEIDWNANLAVMQRCLRESDKTEAVW